jgi:hypothetical protein
VAIRLARRSRAARNGAARLEKEVCWLARSVAEIRSAFRSAEARIEACAEERIRTLREDSKEDLAALYDRHQEAKRLVAQLAAASGSSCREIERHARRVVREARTIANAMIERFQRATAD